MKRTVWKTGRCNSWYLDQQAATRLFGLILPGSIAGECGGSIRRIMNGGRRCLKKKWSIRSEVAKFRESSRPVSRARLRRASPQSLPKSCYRSRLSAPSTLRNSKCWINPTMTRLKLNRIHSFSETIK